MEIYLLFGPGALFDAQDMAVLNLRGYEVITSQDVATYAKGESVRHLKRVQVCTVMNCCPGHTRVVVLHPNLDEEERANMVVFCKVLGAVCMDLCDLPALAPEHQASLMELDLCGRLDYGRCDEHNALHKLGDRLASVCRTLLRWEARANAWFGDGLKNPVVSELRKRPVTYRLNTSTSTTG